MGQMYTTLYPSAARTTHDAAPYEFNAAPSDDITVEINVTAFSGTSITFTLQGHDPIANTWYTLVATAAATGTGRLVLHAGPDMPTTTNVSTTRVLPLRVRLLTSGTISSVTYYAYLLAHRGGGR